MSTRPLPDPDLGWKILNELADTIADREQANLFTSDARVLEGGFTSGFISEEQYRLMLRADRLRYMPPHTEAKP